ncbi:DUF1707 SHOCT-like domain-containing protein [Streptomyces sp. MMG1121]|uniref:DUF1707 SHOCT-like domain-containing protein n=1 Tax=Streptomyces sp. MMG1121 TaxID=1415544 RepID=UPI0006AD8C1A|nr:DUF1707 domain-containing protein [Streptomyces sp. MMG1121]KOV57038.1 hypothetical protein ADK64_38815 [Streptomyces sp. MMG1121]
MAADMVDADVPTGLRASHADRDRVVEVLAAAAGDGRLTAEELDERVAAALSARTLGQLAVLTADLPQEAGAAPASAPASAPAKDIARIEQRGAAAVRAGGWAVPRRMEIESAWGDVTLDFSDAVITYDTLGIDLDMRGGTLRLITRPGVLVDADFLVRDYVKTKVRPPGDPEAPVVLRVEIRGRLGMGRLEVRPPRRWFGR